MHVVLVGIFIMNPSRSVPLLHPPSVIRPTAYGFLKNAYTLGTLTVSGTSRVPNVTSRDERAPDKGIKPEASRGLHCGEGVQSDIGGGEGAK